MGRFSGLFAKKTPEKISLSPALAEYVSYAYAEWYGHHSSEYEWFYPEAALLPDTPEKIREALRLNYLIGEPEVPDWISSSTMWTLYSLTAFHISAPAMERVQRFNRGRVQNSTGERTPLSTIFSMQPNPTVFKHWSEDQFMSSITELRNGLSGHKYEYPDDLFDDLSFVRNLALERFTDAAARSIEWKFYINSIGKLPTGPLH